MLNRPKGLGSCANAANVGTSTNDEERLTRRHELLVAIFVFLRDAGFPVLPWLWVIIATFSSGTIFSSKEVLPAHLLFGSALLLLAVAIWWLFEPIVKLFAQLFEQAYYLRLVEKELYLFKESLFILRYLQLYFPSMITRARVHIECYETDSERKLRADAELYRLLHEASSLFEEGNKLCDAARSHSLSIGDLHVTMWKRSRALSFFRLRTGCLGVINGFLLLFPVAALLLMSIAHVFEPTLQGLLFLGQSSGVDEVLLLVGSHILGIPAVPYEPQGMFQSLTMFLLGCVGLYFMGFAISFLVSVFLEDFDSIPSRQVYRKQELKEVLAIDAEIETAWSELRIKMKEFDNRWKRIGRSLDREYGTELLRDDKVIQKKLFKILQVYRNSRGLDILDRLEQMPEPGDQKPGFREFSG